MVIARVVLDDQHWADAALLVADYWVQVGVVDLAAVEIVKITVHMDTSFYWYVKERPSAANAVSRPPLKFHKACF